MDSREAFEKWMHDTWMDNAEFDPDRNCYIAFPVQMAWKGWQAATQWAGLEPFPQIDPSLLPKEN